MKSYIFQADPASWLAGGVNPLVVEVPCHSTVLQGAMDASNLLKPVLGCAELRCISAATLDEYRAYLVNDPALEWRFQQVYVEQPV